MWFNVRVFVFRYHNPCAQSREDPKSWSTMRTVHWPAFLVSDDHSRCSLMVHLLSWDAWQHGVVMSTRRYGHPMVNGRRLEAWPMASYRSCWTWLRLASIPMKTSTNMQGAAGSFELCTVDLFWWIYDSRKVFVSVRMEGLTLCERDNMEKQTGRSLYYFALPLFKDIYTGGLFENCVLTSFHRFLHMLHIMNSLVPTQ